MSIRSLKLASIALAAAGIGLLCVAVTRGGMSLTSNERPMQLVDGASLTFEFSLMGRSNQYIGIKVADASGDMRSELLQISGKASLFAEGRLLKQVDLPSPVYRTLGQDEIVIIEFESEPQTRYTVVIKLIKVPKLIAGKKGIVKLELASYEVEWIGVTFYSGLMCLILGAWLAIKARRHVRGS